MEQDKLDDLFRNIIQENQEDLNEAELNSKESVWDRLDIHKKGSPFPFWKIAAALLFLIFSGAMIFNSYNRQQEKNRYIQLETELRQTKAALLATEAQLSDSKEALQKSTSSIVKSVEVDSKEKAPSRYTTIERVVTIHDTLWIEKAQKVNEVIKLVTDTVFIEVPTTAPSQWVNETSKEEKAIAIDEEIKEIKKKKTPSKVEFVFGKKPLPKRSIKINSFSKEGELARKKDNNLITIPFNN